MNAAVKDYDACGYDASPYGGERTIDTSGWVNIGADLSAYAG
ncbi:hypothetical protein [Desulfosarcina alkanivorans]|nr:hypothetical protein [Desulfosarcina alkanivorans]